MKTYEAPAVEVFNYPVNDVFTPSTNIDELPDDEW